MGPAARIDRRSFLKAAAAAALAPSLPACAGGPYTDDPRLPNVLFVTADDLGWRDLACTGSPNARTPHLDRLAGEGAHFLRAFGVTSSCSSARATFATGQYPHTHGVTGLAHIHWRRQLAPSHFTLAELLAAAGYHTALEGKWHVAPYLPTSWYGYHERFSGLVDMSVPDASRCIGFLERARGHRFYLELNFMQTHRDPAGDFAFAPGHPVDPDAVVVPEYLRLPDWPEVRRDLARFVSRTEEMDALVGDVLTALSDLGLEERTLVVFVSDNGAPYPGSKMTLYDRGIGTPLFLRWPGRIPAGTRSGALVSTLDLVPTVLEAAGLPVPAVVEGRSLLRLARGEPDPLPRDAVFSEMTWHVDHLPTRAVRTERWKYIRNLSDDPVGLDQLADEAWARRLCTLPYQPWLRPRVPEELYDLETDPHEERNLVGLPEHRETLARLRARLDRHLRETADPYAGRPFERRSARRGGPRATA